MTYARRVDDNHGAIIEVFRSLHCSVIDVSGIPIGFDVVVGLRTQAIMVEIKNPARPKSARKLTPNEEIAHLNWKGPKAIVETTDDAANVVQLLRGRHFKVAG